MKRGALEHPKTKRLARAMGKPAYAAMGLVEALIHWATKYVPQGNVGKYEDWEIEDAVGWDDAEGTLVPLLVEAGFLEAHDEHRVVIHDWYDHADDSVHMQLARAGLRFWCGRTPKMGRLTQAERDRAKEAYREDEKSVRTESAHEAHTKRTQNALGDALPCLALPSPPKPCPSPPDVVGLVGSPGKQAGREGALAEAGIGGAWAKALLASPVTEEEVRAEIARCRGDPKIQCPKALIATTLAERHSVRLPGRKREPETVAQITAKLRACP